MRARSSVQYTISNTYYTLIIRVLASRANFYAEYIAILHVAAGFLLYSKYEIRIRMLTQQQHIFAFVMNTKIADDSERKRIYLITLIAWKFCHFVIVLSANQSILMENVVDLWVMCLS